MLDSSSENSEPLIFSLVNRPEEKNVKKSSCCTIFDNWCLWWFFHNDVGLLYDDEEMYKDAYCSWFNCCPECLTIHCEKNCSYFKKQQTQFLCCCCSIIFQK
jgi:hypothetical protein